MSNVPETSAAAAAVPVAPAAETCPLCHTAAPVVRASDGDWTCTTCAQHWSALALQTAASYAVYAATHPSAKRSFAGPKPV